MSASINGSDISLTRGDSLVLGITITKGDIEYTPVQGDVVRFALKHVIADDEPLIIKNADISTNDTKELAFGTYVYDIQLTTHDGFVDTFIGPAKFNLTEEVW